VLIAVAINGVVYKDARIFWIEGYLKPNHNYQIVYDNAAVRSETDFDREAATRR